MTITRIGALAICAALALGGTANAAGAKTLTVQMKALNGSGENGIAVLTQESDGVHIALTLKNGLKDKPQPTHIHIGTCGNINKAPEYALNNTVEGKGKSTVKGVKLSDLMAGKYAINVHKSGDDLGTYVSCGDIK